MPKEAEPDREKLRLTVVEARRDDVGRGSSGWTRKL